MSERRVSDLLKDQKFHLFIITAGMFFFLLTAVKTNIGSPEASVYWYASELYWTFWVGISLAVVGVLLSVKNDNKYLTVISIFLPLFYFYTLPTLVHDMLPVFDVYHLVPQLHSIIEEGFWNPQLTPFPGSHIYQASSVMILDLDIITYGRLFPTLLAFSIVLFIFSIAKRISFQWAPIAPLTFLALNWYMEYHLARQGFTLMLWAAFWLVLFLYLEKKDYRLGLLAGLLLFTIPLSHPGMIAIVLFNLLALTLVTLLSFKDKIRWNYLFPALPLTIVLGISFFVFYWYVPPVNELITTKYEQILGGSLKFTLGGPATTSPQYAFVNRLRMSVGIIQSLLGLLGTYILYKLNSEKALLLGSWFFSCYLWLIYPFTSSHPGATIERAFLTALIPASILTVAFLKHLPLKKIKLKKIVRLSTVMIIIAFLLTIPIIKNSIDTIETPSRPSYKAGRFTQEKMAGRVYVTDTHRGMFKYLESKHGSEVSFIHSGKHPLNQPYGYPIPRTDNPDLSPILFTDYFNNYIEIRYGNKTAVEEIKQYETQISHESNRVYDSGGSRLYRDN